MSPSLQAYDALPSESTSSSQTLCQTRANSQPDPKKVEQSAVPPTSKRSSRFCTSRLWTSWKWESAVCLLILAIPVITFATLHPHNGQPLPQWPFKVSINSLLSVYALTLKASIGFILASCIGQLQWAWFSDTRPLSDMVCFDSATRGADGALGLIWRQKLRQPLTTLGCIIMVLAIAIDPFVQQLVRPVNCSVGVSGDHAAAVLPRANVFAGNGYNGYVNRSGSPIPQRTDIETTDKDIAAILYDAMFSPGQAPPWQCLTGNCTFPIYGTIGFCSSCQDASANVTITATCSVSNSSDASSHPTSAADCPDNSNFTLDSNLTFGEYTRLGTRMTISSVERPGTVVLADAASEMETGHFNTRRSLVFGFLLGATAGTGGRIDWIRDNNTCDPMESEASWSCRGHGAALCYLRPCVQTYSANISAGVLEEHLVDSSSDTPWGKIYDPNGKLAFLTLKDAYCSYATQPTSSSSPSRENRWLPYDYNLSIPFTMNYMDETPLPDDAMSLLESGCLYLMSPDSIMDVLTIVLSGEIKTSGFEPIGQGSQSEDLTIPPGLLVDFEGPVMMQGIYNWGHTSLERVQSIIANISDSLTTHIRKHGGTPQVLGSLNFSRDVQGNVYHYATCLEVEWSWLSFPASLAILTALLLLMVVNSTKMQGDSTWKASPLAWILRAEGPDREAFPSSHGSCEKMKERSKQIAVHLSDGDLEGPRIRMADLKDPNLL